jgi:hypothetical protein
MVEAAFVTPVFVVLIFSVIEFSGYVAATTGANAAVKAGARMATVAGNDPMADRRILTRMSREGSGLVSSNDVIERVKIWKASGPDDDPPETCNASTHCNLYEDPNQDGGAYSKAHLPLTTDEDPVATMTPAYADYWFGCQGAADPTADHKLDCGWPPTSRRIMQRSPSHIGPCAGVVCDPPDRVGIWVQVRHNYYTGLFGQYSIVTSKTISAIEPQEYDK